MDLEGGKSITPFLQKLEIVADLSLTRGEQPWMGAFNMTEEVLYLTPKTTMMNFHAETLDI